MPADEHRSKRDAEFQQLQRIKQEQHSGLLLLTVRSVASKLVTLGKSGDSIRGQLRDPSTQPADWEHAAVIAKKAALT
jgi:hypothetical protein